MISKRKAKKNYLGRRLTKSKIRLLIKKLVIVPAKGSKSTEGIPFLFCPECGCQAVKWGYDRAEYPERWVSGYCARCGYHVWESDNSPYYHCLECEGFKIY